MSNSRSTTEARYDMSIPNTGERNNHRLEVKINFAVLPEAVDRAAMR